MSAKQYPPPYDPSMKRAWNSVDRWGPLVVSILVLMVVIALGWQYDEKISKVSGRADGLQEQVDMLQQQINNKTITESALRTEIQTWQAHVVTLRITMAKSGLEVPKEPETTVHETTIDKKEEK